MTLRLTSFSQDPSGQLTVLDIVEPLPRYASWWFNHLRRNPDTVLIEASSAERPLSDHRVAYRCPQAVEVS